MATVLDVSVIEYFSPILLFLIVFTTTYGILNKAKFFESNKGINAIISFSLSLIFVFSGPARTVLEFVIPWYLILGAFVLVILIILGIFGIEPNPQAIVKDGNVLVLIIIFSAVILIIGLSQALGQAALEKTMVPEDTAQIEEGSESTATTSFTDNLYRTLFHPKVIGSLMLILVGVFTILLLAGTPKKQ